jgi:two-component system response regulator HydG
MPEKKASVLIVDDDASMSRTMSLVLARKGYEVSTAPDGPTAIGMVKDRPFDIIFMDIKMPVMDGVEAFEKIKVIRPDAVVVMMTAYALEDLVQKALREGAYDIIYKPLDIGKVFGTIEEVKARGEGMLVMVVDDDPGTLKSLGMILKNKGHRVGTAVTGEEAIAMAKEKRYDIIFIDLKLPTINGLQTYLAIREVDPRVVAVMMTAYRQEMGALAETAVAESAYSVLYKPLDMEILLKMVDEMGKRKRV